MASVKVSAHTRVSKKGNVYHVDAYMRALKGMGNPDLIGEYQRLTREMDREHDVTAHRQLANRRDSVAKEVAARKRRGAWTDKRSMVSLDNKDLLGELDRLNKDRTDPHRRETLANELRKRRETWTGNQPFPSANQDVGRDIPDLAKRANEGFTFDPFAHKLKEHGGYVVARVAGSRVYDEVGDETVAAQRLEEFMDANPDADYYGGWYNKEDGKLYLDVVDIVKQRDAALERGRAQNQISIFWLDGGVEMDTGGTGQHEEET